MMFASSLIRLACFLIACIPMAAQSFTQSEISTGPSPVAIITPDLNGDGRPDVVTANYANHTISVRLWQSGSYSLPLEHATGEGPVALVAGDLNGDGVLDVVTANQTGNSISILLGSGDGSFLANSDWPVGVAPNSIIAGDLNHDGKLDIATANGGSGTISLRFGNGTGGFYAAGESVAGTAPANLVTGDFNGDLWPDLVWSNSTSVHFRMSTDVANQWTASTGSLDPGLTKLAALNLVEGTPDDLAYIYSNCLPVCVLVKIHQGLPGGYWSSAIEFDLGADYFSGLTTVQAADLDLDGRRDVMLAALPGAQPVDGAFEASFLYYLRSNTGGFGPQQRLALGESRDPVAIAAADAEGDGDVDIFLANRARSTVSILSNAPSGACRPPASNGISVCSPADGGVYSGPVLMSAAATMSAEVKRMELWVDGSKRFESAAAQLSTSLELAAGTRRVVFVAVDASGTVIKRTLYITIKETAAPCPIPSVNAVNLCEPAEGATLPPTFHISAAARMSNPIARFEVWINGNKHSEFKSSDSFRTTATLPSGLHRIVVKAIDTAGMSTGVVRYVTVADQDSSCAAPSGLGVNICSPGENATVEAPVRIVATANTAVAPYRTEVWIDGLKRYEALQSSAVDTTLSLSPGQHRLTVQSPAPDGTNAKKTIYFTVR